MLADRGATHFAVDLMVKDMGLVRRLAESEGVPLDGGRAGRAHCSRELRDAGHGGSDFSILAAVQAQAAGAELPERSTPPRGRASAG